MTTIQDAQNAAIAGNDALPDKLLRHYQANGATSPHITDAFREFLIAQGASPEFEGNHTNDLERDLYINVLGLDKLALPELRLQFWDEFKGVVGLTPRPNDRIALEALQSGWNGAQFATPINAGATGSTGPQYEILTGAAVAGVFDTAGVIWGAGLPVNSGASLRANQNGLRFFGDTDILFDAPFQINQFDRIELRFLIRPTDATTAAVRVWFNDVESTSGEQNVARNIFSIDRLGNYNDTGSGGNCIIWHFQARQIGGIPNKYFIEEGSGNQLFPQGDGPVATILGTENTAWRWVDRPALVIPNTDEVAVEPLVNTARIDFPGTQKLIWHADQDAGTVAELVTGVRLLGNEGAIWNYGGNLNVGTRITTFGPDIRMTGAGGSGVVNYTFSPQQIIQGNRVDLRFRGTRRADGDLDMLVWANGVPATEGSQVVGGDHFTTQRLMNLAGTQGQAEIFYFHTLDPAGNFRRYDMSEGVGNTISVRSGDAAAPTGTMLGSEDTDFQWTPFTLPVTQGVLEWWRADKGVGLVSTDQVDTWEGRSAFATPLTAPTNGRFTYVPRQSGFNFRPVMQSESPNDTMATALIAQAQPFTVIMCFQALAGTQTNLQRMWADANDDTPNAIYRGDNNNIQLDCGVPGMVFIRDGLLPQSMMGWTPNGAQSEIILNGEVVERDDAGTQGLTNGFRILNRGAGSRNTPGYLAEVIVYDRVLTATELTALRDYFENYYRLGLSLKERPDDLVGVRPLTTTWRGVDFASNIDFSGGAVDTQWEILTAIRLDDTTASGMIWVQGGSTTDGLIFQNVLSATPQLGFTGDVKFRFDGAFANNQRLEIRVVGTQIAGGAASVRCFIDGVESFDGAQTVAATAQTIRGLHNFKTASPTLGRYTIFYFQVKRPDGTVVRYLMDENTGTTINPQAGGVGPVGTMPGTQNTDWEWQAVERPAWIGTPAPPTANVGSSYTYDLSPLITGTAPITLSVVQGQLPAGLAISGLTITGTATQEETQTGIVIRASNAAGTADSNAFTMETEIPQFAPRPNDQIAVEALVTNWGGAPLSTVFDWGNTGNIGDQFEMLIGARRGAAAGVSSVMVGSNSGVQGITLRSTESSVRFQKSNFTTVDFTDAKIGNGDRVEVRILATVASATEMSVTVEVDGVQTPEGAQIVDERSLFRLGNIGNYNESGLASGCEIYHVQVRRITDGVQARYFIDENTGTVLRDQDSAETATLQGTEDTQWRWVRLG